MTVPVRINVDGAYMNGLVPLAASNVSLGAAGWFDALDQAQYVSINGDVGSSHSPTAVITVGGAGMIFQGCDFQLTGGLLNIFGSGSRLVHGDSDYVSYVPVDGIYNIEYRITNLSDGYDASFFDSNSIGRFYYDPLTGSLLNYAGNVNYVGGGRIICPLEVRDGATLMEVVFFFTTAIHSAVPESLPTFRVIQVDVDGNVTPLLAEPTSPGWAGDGFLQYNPPPVSGAAWSGFRSFGTPTGAVTIDLTQYSYFVEINDESGANALPGNYYHSARAQLNFPDLRPA